MTNSIESQPSTVEEPEKQAGKHTPGPWEQGQLYIRDSKNPSDPNYRYIRAGDGYLLNEAKGSFGISGFIRPQDARLIAASPDLLEALKLCKATLAARGGPSAKERDTAIAAARAAIAKAEGGQP